MPILNNSNNSNNLTNALVGGSFLNQATSSQPQAFQQNGFNVPPIPSADSSGLPSSQIPSLQLGTNRRNIMTWFVPEVGAVSMYINPQNVNYHEKKLVQSQRTKGGYVVQYWGEELMTISLSGHTGSSGVEGLNVLEEVYRSEQLLFDPLALTMAASSSISGVNDLVSGVLGNVLPLGQNLQNATQGVLGLDPLSQSILPQNIPSLASMALGIELYYAGWVFRGYFTSISYSESVDHMGLFNYTMEFVVTQRRGYRTNNFAFQRSADNGPSNNSQGGIPVSFAGMSIV